VLSPRVLGRVKARPSGPTSEAQRPRAVEFLGKGFVYPYSFPPAKRGVL